MTSTFSTGLHFGLGNVPLISNVPILWTPNQSGVTIEAWYNSEGNTTANGFIDSYQDKSGNNRNMSASTSAGRPSVDTGFIRFDGVDDVIDFSDEIVPKTDFNIFFLARAGIYDSSEDLNQNYFFTNTGSTRYSLIRTNATSVRVSAGSPSLETSYPINNNETFLFGATFKLGSSNSTIYKNAEVYSTVTETAFPTLTGIRFGGRTSALRIGQFDLYEAFFISSTIDTDYRQRAEGYICHNNGLSSLLPIGHPYKDVPPKI